jgi:hypothetical protein
LGTKAPLVPVQFQTPIMFPFKYMAMLPPTELGTGTKLDNDMENAVPAGKKRVPHRVATVSPRAS